MSDLPFEVVLERLPHRYAIDQLRQVYLLLDRGWHQRHQYDDIPHDSPERDQHALERSSQIQEDVL